jgi:uncharacterized protein (DUF1810 family)
LSADDPYDLERFVAAQRTSYERALAEIKDGDKVSHWMWYVFPQVAGLGFSVTSRKYAIKSLDEARAYLAHPLLGRRLAECASAALAVEGRSAKEIFASPDDMKLRSCATLFAQIAGDDSVFQRLLDKYFDGVPDTATLRFLGRAQ